MTVQFAVTEEDGQVLEILKMDSSGTYRLVDREWELVDPLAEESEYPTIYEAGITLIERSEILGYLQRQSSQ